MTTVTVPTKPWYTSKLFWLGVLEIISGVSGYLTEAITTQASVGSILFGLLTIVLRYVTKQPITFTGRSIKSVER